MPKDAPLSLTSRTMDELSRVGYRRADDFITLGEEAIQALNITIGQRDVLLDYTRTAQARAAERAASLLPASTDEPRLDQGECLEERNIMEQVRQVVKIHVLEHGVQGLPQVIECLNDEYMSTHILLGVIGGAGNGKSTLINSLRGLRACDHAQGAAPVGYTETTNCLTAYSFPKAPNVRLWDLPGVNTPGYERDNYLASVEFDKYDAFIIVSSKRFTQDDLWLAKEANAQTKPFFFVRTKLDEDVRNHIRDCEGEGQTDVMVEHIRRDITHNLRDKELPSDRIYVMSGVLEFCTEWDFPRLVNDLTYSTPGKNSAGLILAIVTASEKVIDQRAQILRERLKILKDARALCCASELVRQGAGLEDSVDVSKWCDETEWIEVLCIRKEMSSYAKLLGLATEDLVNVDMDVLDQKFLGLVKSLEQIEISPIPNYTGFRDFVKRWPEGFTFGLAGWFDEKLDPKKARVRQKECYDSGMCEAFDILDRVLEGCVEAAKAVLRQRQSNVSTLHE